MNTRRDNPKGSLWRVAVEGFNHVLVDDASREIKDYIKDPNTYRSARVRLWKEVADVYEIFLVGSCGRALTSDAPSAEVLKTDELIELTVLSVLGDKVLKSQIDAPLEVNYALDRFSQCRRFYFLWIDYSSIKQLLT